MGDVEIALCTMMTMTSDGCKNDLILFIKGNISRRPAIQEHWFVRDPRSTLTLQCITMVLIAIYGDDDNNEGARRVPKVSDFVRYILYWSKYI